MEKIHAQFKIMNFICSKWLWTFRSNYHWCQVQFFIRVNHIYIVIIGIHLHPLRNSHQQNKIKRKCSSDIVITCIKQTSKYEIQKHLLPQYIPMYSGWLQFLIIFYVYLSKKKKKRKYKSKSTRDYDGACRFDYPQTLGKFV